MNKFPTRLLSIGEFSAATQLSAKALRLYDEQQLITPSHIDAANGYRYYRSDQVTRGRQIRVLREMGLSLADVAKVVAAEGGKAERVLSRFAKDQDRRHAREKRAFHTALVMLNPQSDSALPDVVERTRGAQVVAVREFSVGREEFIERYRAERQELERQLADAELDVIGPASCALLDPLVDDGGRLEVIVPVARPSSTSQSIAVREIGVVPCAVIKVDNRRTHAAEFTAALDALFDWFDRRGFRSADAPRISIDGPDSRWVEIEWAYLPA